MKNLFKSIFIAIFPMVAICVFATSIIQLVQQGFSYLSLGNLLTSTTITILFAGLLMELLARKDTKKQRIYKMQKIELKRF